MCENLASGDVGEAGDAMAKGLQVDAVDTCYGLLFQGVVRGQIFSEDFEVGSVLADNGSGLGGGVASRNKGVVPGLPGGTKAIALSVL